MLKLRAVVVYVERERKAVCVMSCCCSLRQLHMSSMGVVGWAGWTALEFVTVFLTPCRDGLGIESASASVNRLLLLLFGRELCVNVFMMNM